MAIWTLAKKEFVLLLRDRLAALLLLVLPFLCILILGLLLGEGFWQKPDERLRISVVNLDQGHAEIGVAREAIPPTPEVRAEEVASLLTLVPTPGMPPMARVASTAVLADVHYKPASWADLVIKDLRETAGIRVETIPGEEEAKRLCKSRQRSAVIIFGPQFSSKVSQSSFLSEGINPFYRDGVDLSRLDVQIVKDETQLASAAIIDQAAQVTMLRVVMPYMIGRAFERLGEPAFVDRLGEDVRLPMPDDFRELIVGSKEMLSDPQVRTLREADKLLRGGKLDAKLKRMGEQIGKVGLVLAPDVGPENAVAESVSAPLTGVGGGLGGAVEVGVAWRESQDVLILNRDRVKLGDLIEMAAGYDENKTPFYRGRIGDGVQKALQNMFERYNLTGKTWTALTRSIPRGGEDLTAPKPTEPEGGTGVLKFGAQRYQILVPSYTVMFAFSLILTVGWLFVAERSQGTLRRLRAAPLTRSQILLGKVLPCFALSMLQGVMLLTLGKVVFGMRWGPDDWPLWQQVMWLLPVVVTTSLAAVGLSMFVAAVSRTPMQVAIFGSLLILAFALVSGCLIPRTLMPEEMQSISLITPHAWALQAYTELLPASSTQEPNLQIVLQSCGVLTGFGLGFLGLAWWIMPLD